MRRWSWGRKIQCKEMERWVGYIRTFDVCPLMCYCWETVENAFHYNFWEAKRRFLHLSPYRDFLHDWERNTKASSISYVPQECRKLMEQFSKWLKWWPSMLFVMFDIVLTCIVRILFCGITCPNECVPPQMHKAGVPRLAHRTSTLCSRTAFVSRPDLYNCSVIQSTLKTKHKAIILGQDLYDSDVACIQRSKVSTMICRSRI